MGVTKMCGCHYGVWVSLRLVGVTMVPIQYTSVTMVYGCHYGVWVSLRLVGVTMVPIQYTSVTMVFGWTCMQDIYLRGIGSMGAMSAWAPINISSYITNECQHTVLHN